MKPHILIVDDEPAIRELLSFYLHKKGFTATALSMKQALDQHGQIFKLAILDASSSTRHAKDNCLKLIARLKSKHPQTNILIFHPLFDDSDFSNRALVAGVNGFLTKTGGLDKLLSEVNRWSRET